MLLSVFCFIALSAPSAVPAEAQSCEITGKVPRSIRENICAVATSVHGGDAPVNQLTLMLTREVAYAIRARTPDADNFMLTLLDRWMTDRGVSVARVEVFYGRAHIATAETHMFSTPSVTYH